MSEFKPVETVNDLNTLDDQEIMDGYALGFRGAPEPGSDKSRSVWHGWRNGMVDKGLLPKDEAQILLAREVIRYQRAH